MTSRYIKQEDLMLLWGRAAGLCSICRTDLLKKFQNSGNENLGESAHIIPHSKNGPRGDGNTKGDNTYDNLILLCGLHHTEIDKAHKDYPREKLIGIKKSHETYVRERTADGKNEFIISPLFKLLKNEKEPKIVPVLLVEGSRHFSWSKLVPKWFQRMLGDSYGYYIIGINLKNIGEKQANRVTLGIKPVMSSLPEGFTFSTMNHVTKNTMPSSFEKKISCGPVNVGELIIRSNEFYLNYKRDPVGSTSREIISDIIFEYYLTCDSDTPSIGELKIINA